MAETLAAIRFRVIKITTTDFSEPPKVSEESLWEGTDIDELSIKYPPSEIWGADKLSHSELEDGYIRFNYRFERQTEENGAWEEIEDPRRRLTPISAYELEIQAENQRLFPEAAEGDYLFNKEPLIEEDFNEEPCTPWEPSGAQIQCFNCYDEGCEHCECETLEAVVKTKHQPRFPRLQWLWQRVVAEFWG